MGLPLQSSYYRDTVRMNEQLRVQCSLATTVPGFLLAPIIIRWTHYPFLYRYIFH